MKILLVQLILLFSSAACQTVNIAPLYTIDKPADSLNFNQPQGLSIDSNGHLYISDTKNHRILKMDQQGNILSKVGGIGWLKNQFQNPMGLYVFNTMNVFVADHDNHRIVRFDKNLNWITELSPEYHWDDRFSFSFPMDIFTSFYGDYFIIDAENRGIIKLDSGFSPVLTFGGYDWGKGALSRPVSIFLSNNDNVFVSDYKAGRIFVYDYYGNYLYNFGKNILKHPLGLFIDSNNRIYATDEFHHSLYIFDEEGRMLIKFGTQGNKLGAFNAPSDVVVFNNKLFVLESLNNRIQVLSIVFSQ
ncbi:MAG: NHL repeat-containing protein [candidate division KSB1 bacterium]|nr:NHL repeat-containing protein [candidate division KSB1 bacterium]